MRLLLLKIVTVNSIIVGFCLSLSLGKGQGGTTERTKGRRDSPRPEGMEQRVREGGDNKPKDR